MNAFLWGRDLRRHYWSGRTFNPLASLSDFKMLARGGVRVLWSSLHVPESEYFDCRLLRLVAALAPGGRKLLKRNGWECLVAMKDGMEEQVARSAERFEVARSNSELDRVLASGRTAIIHTVEGADVLGEGLGSGDVAGRLGRVDELADWGVASLTLAHLFENDIAGHTEGIPDLLRRFPCRLDSGVDLTRGLTELGEAVVERLVERRIVPDVTHCTPAARRRVYELAGERIPIVASHVGVQTLNKVPYNLDASDVTQIAASGGVVGVIFMPYWLDATHPKRGLDAIWKTMVQVAEWSSWEHIAIGTDFDGFTDPPDDCKNASELRRVREMLQSKGLASNTIDGVLGANARRVLRQGWR